MATPASTRKSTTSADTTVERQARRIAEREGREYVPVTGRGEITHAVRQARAALADLREQEEQSPKA